MRRTEPAPAQALFVFPGYRLLAASVAAGAALALVEPRWALLAPAVVFGWSQIGGL